jgi:hypothetical protein
MQGCSLLLCYECDVKQHTYAHFHRRQTWGLGFYESLPPTTFITAAGDREQRSLYFPVQLVPGTKCRHCEGTSWASVPSAYKPLKHVLHGQLDFVKAGYGCLGCGYVMWQGIEEFVSIGLWPTSVTQVCRVIDERLLLQYQALTAKAPRVSRGAFLTTVAAGDLQYGGKVSRSPT